MIVRKDHFRVQRRVDPTGQQRCRVGALADGDGDPLHIVGIGRNFDVGFGMGFLILFPD